jgi:hypothetical protein
VGVCVSRVCVCVCRMCVVCGVAPARVGSRVTHRVGLYVLQRCKEVVLKDFEFCYKHYGLAVRAMVGKEGYILACSRSDKLASVCTLLAFRVHCVCVSCRVSCVS